MTMSLRIIGLFGCLFFASLFLLTYGFPGFVEQSAKGFVKKQIETEIVEKYRASKAATVADKLKTISHRFGAEKRWLTEGLQNKLPEKIASVIAQLCGYDCEKKKALGRSIARGYINRIGQIEIAQQQLGALIKGKYLEIVGALRADLRIFLGSNTLMFLILFAISLLKPKAVAHLYLPGVFLLLATIASTAIYLFGQNWFYTILYNDYMGYGYLVYIGVIFALLMDITFNRGRICVECINAVFNAIGSAATLTPC